LYNKNGDKYKLQKQLFILTVVELYRQVIDIFYWKSRGLMELRTRVRTVIQLIPTLEGIRTHVLSNFHYHKTDT